MFAVALKKKSDGSFVNVAYFKTSTEAFAFAEDLDLNLDTPLNKIYIAVISDNAE